MLIKGHGRLRHQFHSKYACLIALEFESMEDCESAITKLLMAGRWEGSSKHPKIAVGHLSSEELEGFKQLFRPKAQPCNSFGHKNAIHEIDGIEHSIDYGPPFNIQLEVENKKQGKLF